MIATIPFDALTGSKGFVVGEAAEIEDHTSRGRNMDTHTPASQCRFVN